MIVSASTLMGISVQRKLCDRVRILQELISFLQELKAEIVFRAAPIMDILTKFAGKERYFTANYFKRVCGNLEVFGLQSAAEYALDELKKLPLTEGDLQEIYRIFNAIGRYDVLTQAEALTRSLAMMEYQLADAKEQLEQKGKIYRAVGFSCGLAFALIMI